ncbi:hypothetical protein CBP31_14505 [Oceanisphaera profunda]|uniref:histidine kinase n=1 Tax=Oceanisphaera profunda TaxID=1416627 RepID=A0A1Y0D926_9GAMM|nr:hypothetical protein CBP31_14505 [Oceanisphaera profunda]
MYRLLGVYPLLLLSFSALSQPYQVGFLAVRGATHAQAQWAPTLALLNAQVPDHEFIGHYLSQEQLDAALAEQSLDFVVTNPAHFMLSHHQPLNWLASYLDPHYGQARASVAATLWVRADSELTQPEQLRGQRVGAVHKTAFGGYLLVAEQLRKRNISPQELALTFSGYPLDALAYGLRDGVVAAAILPSCLLEDMAQDGLIELANFRALMVQPDSRCVRSTPLYPGWSFASVGNLDESVLRAITQALLQFEIAGQPQWGAAVRLDEVASLLMDWQLGPEPSPIAHERLLRQFMLQHWPWLASFVALLLGHLLYHWRVTVLLRRRSKECAQLHSQVQQKEQTLSHARQRILMGEMATGLAHELNQPLSAIQAYAQAGELMQDTAQHKTAFSQIVAETERGAAIIRRFRQWATQPLPSAEPVDLNELCQELVTRLSPRAEALGVKFKAELKAQLAQSTLNPAMLVTVRPAVEQVLNNLLNNALEAQVRRLSQEPAHQAWISLNVSPVQTGWLLLIEDNAGGIDEDIIRTLQHNLPASHYHGMGIGLLVSHRLVLRLQGQLIVSNTEQGTQVRLLFK